MRALLESDGEVRPTSSLDLFLVLFKWKWTLLGIVAGSVLAVAVWLLLIHDDSYVTHAKLLVKLGAEQSLPSTAMGQPIQEVGYLSADVKSETDILGSSDLMAQVVDRFKLDEPLSTSPPVGVLRKTKYYVKKVAKQVEDAANELMISAGLRERLSPREQAITLLTKSLSVKVDEGSNVIVAELALPFRHDASVVLKALLDDYLRFRLQVYRDRGAELFRKIAAERGRQLASAEAELQVFENSANISSQAKQKDILLEQISAAENAQTEAALRYQDAKSKVDRLDAELKNPNPNLASIGGVDSSAFQRSLLTQMAEIEREREKMRLTELDNSERMQNIGTQYQALANMLAGNLRSVLAERSKDLSGRTNELQSLRQRLAALHQNEMHWLDLKRKVQDFDEDYQFYRKKVEESAAKTAAMEQERSANVVVIEEPMDPIMPAGMRKTWIFGLALAVSLCAALVFISIGEFFDHRIYIREQLERAVGAPVMAVVPRLPGKTQVPQLLSASIATNLLDAGGSS